MLQVDINGRRHEFPAGLTILAALQQLGIEVPTLCHDDRLKPCGACRLCSVEIASSSRYVTACNTPLTDGMEIQSHSPGVEQARRTLLRLLAGNYPAEAAREFPEKQFHRDLARYGVTPQQQRTSRSSTAPDSSHPYIRVDMAQCITCYRCVRICEEVQGQFVWQVWNRGDATQIRPDSRTTLRESSCVGCGACVDSCPSGALEDKTVLDFGIATKWTRTTCPYCGVGCEMMVGTRDNRIVQVKPALDAPVSKGHLCVKGRYAFAFTHASDRVTEPMIRSNGEWKKVSWPDAIALAAGNLKRTTDKYGPESVGVLGSARGTNEDNYLAQKFARIVLGTNNVDCCARVCHAPTAAAMKAMLGTGAATNSFDDIECARGFLLCGTNATENHPIVGARMKQAVLRGAKLIVIDPREIELTRYADIHLALKPGTNVPLLNAMACSIVEEKLFDESAVNERVSDWDEFQKFIRAFTPEKTAAVCGVDAKLIRQAAQLYATTKPAMCFHGLGMTEHVQGTEGVMCLVNLALLTGNFGKPGSGVNPLRGQNNVQGSAQMGCDPGNLTGMVSLEEGRTLFEAVWKASVPKAKGLDLMQMMDAASDGKLKALWAIGYDVALTNPNANATVQSLKSLEFVIVQDMFLNELARDYGSIFFPVASSFERDGTFMNSERRIQRVRKVIEAPGQAKADWEIICELARAMGKGEFFDFHFSEEIWEEIRAVWKAGHGITYARLEGGGLQWPCPTEEHPGTTVLHAKSFPSGPRAPLKRIEFRPSDETTSPEFPFLLTTGRTLYQFNAGTMTMRTANAELRPTDTLDISPEDAKRLALDKGEQVRVRSRHGEAVLPVRIDSAVKPGELFATFHTTQVFLNRLTSPERDNIVHTPEYKVVAVRLEKAAAGVSPFT
ncbi:MAG TPA: formate dehydrogenase subunit alpha [Chthoniobacterales bacterium]